MLHCSALSGHTDTQRLGRRVAALAAPVQKQLDSRCSTEKTEAGGYTDEKISMLITKTAIQTRGRGDHGDVNHQPTESWCCARRLHHHETNGTLTSEENTYSRRRRN